MKHANSVNTTGSGRYLGRRSLTIFLAAALGLAGLANGAAAQPIAAGDTVATTSSTLRTGTAPAASAVDNKKRRCVYPGVKRCVSITIRDGGWAYGESAVRDVGGDGQGYRVAAEWIKFQYQVNGEWKTHFVRTSYDGWWATKDTVGEESFGNYICSTGYKRVRVVGYFKWVRDGSNKVGTDMVASPSVVC